MIIWFTSLQDNLCIPQHENWAMAEVLRALHTAPGTRNYDATRPEQDRNFESNWIKMKWTELKIIEIGYRQRS
jgi:hypothetical protein